MADRNTPEHAPERRRKLDPVTLVAGIASVLIAAYVLTDGQFGVPFLDGRWLLAGGTAVVGALLLLSSLRRKR
ncbi:hypothetical protein [Sciscionella sediminilitoris]|uniref:hypothetical protein n=1 Tax=Sciscionella sediminilitoris TaxID=1445613 RepID=UPI0004DF0B82|nr:hypothetical protein [Sciscionella sp. SE31]